MNTNNLAAFTELVTNVSALYRIPLSSKSLGLYWDALQKFEWKEIKTAFQKHLTDPDAGQYFPKPADVVRQINGNSETQALKAWSKVDEAIHSIGCYASVVFDDPIIHIVIDDMGGWIRLCQTLVKDLLFRAHEFKKYYAGYVNHPSLSYPKQLLGLEAQQNNLQGYSIEPPLLIGDPHSALMVWQSGSEKQSHLPTLNALLTTQCSLENHCGEQKTG